MEKHFVTFYSPGTFIAEQTTKEIESWDIETAIKMARNIIKRYNTTPYGFQFTTRRRKQKEFDSRETGRSCMYYLGGNIKTLEEIKKMNNPQDRTLIRNMEINGYNRIITNANSWNWTAPLNDEDIVLDFKI